MSENLENRISSTQAKDAIFKAHSIGSSASGIDAVANVNNTRLIAPHTIFRKAANGIILDGVIIVSGDSTNSIGYAEMQSYYKSQTAKLNMSYYDNSFSGQKGSNWMNNIGTNTLQQAINNSTGVDGANTIMIYSFGINDYDGTNTEADIKNIVKTGIQAYLTAKPKATVIILRPNRTASDTLATWLGNIYTQVSDELGLFLVSAYDITVNKWGNPLFYYDTTHPNRWGARAVMNNTFSKIVPVDLMNKLTLEEYDGTSISWSNYCLKNKLDIGHFWNTTTAEIVTDANWVCLEEVAVTVGDVLICSHQGNRTNFIFVNDIGTKILYVNPTPVNKTFTVTVPPGATKLRINISSDATNYLLLNDIPTLHKQTVDAGIYMDLRNINVQQKLPNRVISTRYGIIVDGYGKIGAVGESLKIDSNNKMKWSV